MESLDQIKAFARHRERLLERLTEQRKDLDRWLEEHVGDEKDVSTLALATLAGIVQMRRDTLMDLVKLDDELLQRVLGRHQSERQGKEADSK